MKTLTLLLVGLTVLAGIALARADEKFYDARGNHISTTTRDSAGNTTTYDARGNVIDRSSPIYGGRNYYDAGGNHTGTSYFPPLFPRR